MDGPLVPPDNPPISTPSPSPLPHDNSNDGQYITTGGLVYGILCTVSMLLVSTLAVVYWRLNYNRVFVYFCASVVALFVPHVLGAWIFGAHLSRASTAVCWVQALWINAAGIAAGLTVLIYTWEIYRNVVWNSPSTEYTRRKYYIALSIMFPVLVGLVPPAIIAEKPNGIVPGAYFCFLYTPAIPLTFVSIAGWNTLLAIPAIYFSLRTALEVAKVLFTRKGFDTTLDNPIAARRPGVTIENLTGNRANSAPAVATRTRTDPMPNNPISPTHAHNNSFSTIPSHAHSNSGSTVHSRMELSGDLEQPSVFTNTDIVNNSIRTNTDTTTVPSPPPLQRRLSDHTIASIPVFVCIRLLLFGLLYSGVTVGVSGRNLYLAVRLIKYDFQPSYIDYLIASIGIIIWIVFGTSMEALHSYGRGLRTVFSLKWIRRLIFCLQNDESFGDWEIQRAKRDKAKQEKQFTRERSVSFPDEQHGQISVHNDDVLPQLPAQIEPPPRPSYHSQRQHHYQYRLPPLQEVPEMDITEFIPGEHETYRNEWVDEGYRD